MEFVLCVGSYVEFFGGWCSAWPGSWLVALKPPDLLWDAVGLAPGCLRLIRPCGCALDV